MTDFSLVTHKALLQHADHHLTVTNEDNQDGEAPVCVAALHCATCGTGVFSVAEDEILEVRLA